MQPRRPWDRNDPGFLRKEPREGDLSRRRVLAFADLPQQIDHRLIGFSGLSREARDDVAEVGAVERRVFVNLPGNYTDV